MNATTNAGPEPAASDPYVVSYLRLCELSYKPPGTIRQAVAGLRRLGPRGTWKCVWGPAMPPDQSNLAYAAAYYDDTGELDFAAVVIRGTDLHLDLWGLLVELFEDLDVLDQEPFPWMPPTSGSLVAQGTLDGLSIIQKLRDGDGGPRLLPFLAEFLDESQAGTAPLVVTGHSLGGCLATVVAPWLQAALSQKGVANAVVPVTFAAPTAGNTAFADRYSSSLPSQRFFNSLDIVPLAWQSLESMKTIYDPDGVPVPEDIDLAITFYEGLMSAARVSYAQPPTNDRELAGQFVTSLTSWSDQAYKQHHPSTYMKLLGGTSAAPAWPRARVRGRL